MCVCFAGGEKYVVGNLFLKFSLDWQNLYGGDEFAMKSSACELKGQKTYNIQHTTQNTEHTEHK